MPGRPSGGPVTTANEILARKHQCARGCVAVVADDPGETRSVGADFLDPHQFIDHQPAVGTTHAPEFRIVVDESGRVWLSCGRHQVRTLLLLPGHAGTGPAGLRGER